MGHITDKCPTYETDALYRCSTCAMSNNTAFHSKFECMKKRNPNKILEEIKTILIDDDGFELEEDETHSGNE